MFSQNRLSGSVAEVRGVLSVLVMLVVCSLLGRPGKGSASRTWLNSRGRWDGVKQI